jgi:glycerophosphoryl diester phosphodiesterase
MNTIKFDKKNTKIIAHRGLSGIERENTNAAFVAAGNRSYYGIETDVHRTADGKFVVIHDDDTKRVGIDKLMVEQTTFETLRSLHLVDKDGKRGRNDLRIPSLQEYIQICHKYGKVSVLELKNHFEDEDIDKIIEIVRAQEHLQDTIFISFDLPNLIYLRSVLPEQPAQYLVGGFTGEVLEALKKYSLDLDMNYRSVTMTKELVDRLHAEGILINVWTVDRLEDAQRMVEYGVDFITSNIIE